MKTSGYPQIVTFDPFSQDTGTGVAETMQLGDLMYADHRVFRYALSGASALGAGKMGLAPAPKTNHHNNTAIASVAGTLTPTFTLGATATVAGEYNEGYVMVNVTPDVGRTYKISNLGLIASGGVATPTLFEPIQTAWTTATRVSLVHNTHANVVESASATRRAAGVPLIAVTAASYYFAQTRGVASTLADGTIALGSRISASPSVAGAVVADSGTYATALVTTPLGSASVMAGVDTEYRPMFLTVD